MSRIEEIKKRLALIPEKLGWLEVNVPKMVADPRNPSKMMRDPHNRAIQTRMDVIDLDDRLKKPIIHFHKYPDHPVYEQNWKAYGDAFINMKLDIEYLISEIKRLTGGK